MDYFEEILSEISSGNISSAEELQKAKRCLCKKYDVQDMPKNSEILKKVKRVNGIERDDVIDVLQRKPTRTKSGVAVIAVMTSPAECPHGRCMMCPGGPHDEEPSPQSYTGEEPAALRGARNSYDPYEQVKDRLNQYETIGHPTDKIDMIVMGGTFPARDWGYQKHFVKRCYDALNGEKSKGLEEAKKKNERAEKKAIGLTIETRPDYCKEKQVDDMRGLGATRVEIGVQTLRDGLLKKIERGHTVKDSVEATRVAKERGLKVCYHMMPGLPGSSPEEDLKEFKKLFHDDRFRPDMLKIYPTLVTKGTGLYDMWKRGEYEPLDTESAAELVAEMKSIVPPFVRIQRVQRDIPSPLVVGGVKKSNLRQYARKEMEKKGLECDCIRCREVGHSKRDINISNIDMKEMDYEASEGKEYFFELGEDDIIAGYARFRVDRNSIPTIRELKVVGEMATIEEREGEYQHRGLGKKLVERCEELSRSLDFDMIRVTSGVGARNYYRKIGYELDMGYMKKKL